MKNLFVFAVILQLPIATAQNTNDYKFGDMIRFPRQTFETPYAHYAIWVGDQDIYGVKRKPGQNIFHITGPACNIPSMSDCVFGTIKKKETHCKHNYLDDEPDYQVRPEWMMARIIAGLHKNCLDWKPYANNCEHLATYIRYGVRLSLQCGYAVGKNCVNDDPKAEELRQRLKDSAPC